MTRTNGQNGMRIILIFAVNYQLKCWKQTLKNSNKKKWTCLVSFNRTLWTSELTREKILFSNARKETILTFKSLFVFHLASAKPRKRLFSTRKMERSKKFLWNNNKTTSPPSLVSRRTVVARRPTRFRCFSLDVIVKIKKILHSFITRKIKTQTIISVCRARVAQCTVAESRPVAVFAGFNDSRVWKPDGRPGWRVKRDESRRLTPGTR